MTLHKITGYSTYVPASVLELSSIDDAIGGSSRGSRAVASFDEDTITMAVSAVRGIGDYEEDNGALLFATSTPPFLDKTNAATVKAAVGGDGWVMATDVTGLRSGVSALVLGARTGGLVAMADTRSGRPGSAEERDGGDGAAAFQFGGAADPIAQVEASAHLSIELMDVWRTPGARHATVSEERFSQTVLSAAVERVVAQLKKDSDLTGPPAAVVVAAPSRRFAAQLAASVADGADTSVLTAHRDRVGFCGAAEAGLLLARVLDVAKAGDTVLLLSVLGGVDGLLVRVLGDGQGSERSDRMLDERRTISYTDYLVWRGLLEREPARRPERAAVAAPAAFRNVRWKFALEGSRCSRCGKVYLPPQRVCGGCDGVDTNQPYPCADRLGTVAAISTDGVSDTPAPPAMAAIVDFDGGGRLAMEVAESTGSDIALGSRVEPTFRRTYQAHGAPNYFWKVRSVRGDSA
jgi:hydroxymethylglutaryl-CoA synthase